MDTRPTASERAADLRAQQDAEHAKARAATAKPGTVTIDRSASLATAEDRRVAAADRAKRRPALVGPLTARLAVENEALAIEERAALALEEAEAEVGDATLWWILTKIFTPDSLTRLLATCRAAVVRFDAAAEAEKAAAKAEKAKPAKAVIPDDETAEERRIREGHEADLKRAVAAKPKAAVAVAVVEPEVAVVDEDLGTLNRFLAEAIVEATKSSNRP